MEDAGPVRQAFFAAYGSLLNPIDHDWHGADVGGAIAQPTASIRSPVP